MILQKSTKLEVFSKVYMEIFYNCEAMQIAETVMGERKMEGENSMRTVDCLRGRLLAERAASRNAKEKADHLENKLMELENMLKQEAKSRNRAEKKLKFLMKKLEFMNISNVSDESEYSGMIEKTDISSISSTASSFTKQQEEEIKNQQTRISEVLDLQESKGKVTSQKDLGDLEQFDSQNSSFSLSGDNSTAGTSISSAFDVHLPQFKGLECEMTRYRDVTSARISETVEQNVAQNATFEDSLSSASEHHSEKSSLRNDQQSGSFRSSGDEEDHDSDSQVDNSMALVVVDTPQTKTNHRIDPEALDGTVKEVLNTLRRAKEELRNSMDRRRMSMIKVGEKNSSVILI